MPASAGPPTCSSPAAGVRPEKRAAVAVGRDPSPCRAAAARDRPRPPPRAVASAVVADPAVEIDAGGRALRVSNPDRVIYPATERSEPVTKLQVVEYYLAVGPGIVRALRDRPTTLERWPK